MKKLILTICLMLFVSGCPVLKPANELKTGEFEKITLWTGGDNEAMFARVGTMVTKNNEVGAVVNWYPNSDRNDSELYGVYAVHHLDGTVEILNPFDRESDEALIQAESYIGIQTALNEKYDEQISGFAGFKFWDVFFTEIQYDAYDNRSAVRDDEIRGVIGVRFKW